jgi:hypothetical protein
MVKVERSKIPTRTVVNTGYWAVVVRAACLANRGATGPQATKRVEKTATKTHERPEKIK